MAETLKTEPTLSVNIEEDVVTIDGIMVDELMMTDFLNFDEYS